MDVVCERCGVMYDLEESQITGSSARVKCSSCDHTFRVYRSHISYSSDQSLSSPLIRLQNGIVDRMPDIATVQRMIVEGTLTAADEISYDGQTWQYLEHIPELKIFFEFRNQSSAIPQTPESANVRINGQSDIRHSTIEFGLPSCPYPLQTPLSSGSYNPQFEHLPPSADVEHQASDVSNYPESPLAQFHQSAIDPQSLEHSYGRADPVAVHKPNNAALSTVYTPVPQTHVPEFEQHNILNSTSYPPYTQAQDFNDATEIAIPGITSSQSELPYLNALDNARSAPQNEPHAYLNADVHNADPPFITASASHQSLSSHNNLRGYEDFSGEHYTPSREELFLQDRIRRSVLSTMLKWSAIAMAIVGLFAGTAYILNPSIFQELAAQFGFAEISPNTQNLLNQAREQMMRLTPDDLSSAHKLLEQAQKVERKEVSAILATRATLELMQVERLMLELHLQQQITSYWQGQAAQLQGTADQGASTNDSDQKATNSSKTPPNHAAANMSPEELRHAIQQLTSLLETWSKDNQRREEQYRKHWNTAKKLIEQAQVLDAHHPYTRLASLQLHSLSAPRDNSDSRSPSLTEFQVKFNQTLQQISDPKLQAWILLYGASVALRLKQHIPASDYLTKVFEQHSTWFYPQLLRVKIYAETGKTDLALQTLGDLEKQSPNHPLAKKYRILLKPPELLALLKSYGRELQVAQTKPSKAKVAVAPPQKADPTKSKQPSIATAITQATRLCESGRLKQGINILNQLTLQGKNARIYNALGWCYFNSKSYTLAIRSFEEAIKLQRNYSDPYYGIGLSYRGLTQFARACEKLKTYLRKFPNSKDAFEVRSLLKSIAGCKQ